ncbi:MAG: hypothetical protein AAF617_02155 [Bacteroidota bacterium]
MKQKKLNGLKLNKQSISNFDATKIVGGETCESPCQGGTGCCETGEECELQKEYSYGKYCPWSRYSDCICN